MSNLSLKQNHGVQIKTSWKHESRKGWEEDRQAKDKGGGGMMEEQKEELGKRGGAEEEGKGGGGGREGRRK